MEMVSHNAYIVSPSTEHIQGASIKNNSLQKMLYFSYGTTDLSQTFRLHIEILIQHIL